MSDNVLRQFTSRIIKPEQDNEANGDGSEDLGNFGWLRGVRDRAIMLELHRNDGSITALGYAWLERVEFDPSEGITLRFTGQTIKIIGRNLNAEARPNVRLMNGLVRHKIPWIKEADQSTVMAATKQSIVIERMVIGEH